MDFSEILVANGVAVLMMFFLLRCRIRSREIMHADDWVYDGMAVTNLLGAVFETISFLVDGRDMPGGRIINMLSSSLSFAATVTIALLWCIYVELRIYRNYKRAFHRLRFLLIPWLLELLALVFNLLRPGLLFSVSEYNVYSRSRGVILGYIPLFVYCLYSLHLAYHSRRQGFSLTFFPILYFVGPCLIGIVIQLFCYGITISWIAVSVAMTFVQMQLFSENLYTDELSGLYNRRYLTGILARRSSLDTRALHGIMLDLDDFKGINDTYGHGAGDRAICAFGDILFKSLPPDGIAIRYAGDEFVVLLFGSDDAGVRSTMNEIRARVHSFNQSDRELFSLSASMGCAVFGRGDDAESFMSRMDNNMYEAKRKYHASSPRRG